jgi:hypothetical protein
MTKRTYGSSLHHSRTLTEKYCGLRGKVVEKIEHEFEDGILYLHVRFSDKTELCWRIAARMTIDQADLSDWKTGNFGHLKVFVRNERDRGR